MDYSVSANTVKNISELHYFCLLGTWFQTLFARHEICGNFTPKTLLLIRV